MIEFKKYTYSASIDLVGKIMRAKRSLNYFSTTHSDHSHTPQYLLTRSYPQQTTQGIRFRRKQQKKLVSSMCGIVRGTSLCGEERGIGSIP